MSYRGIKRVLGESKLERKIRILFGVCLLALIAGSFFAVSLITENLIRENTREKARSLTTDFILRTHLRSVKFPPTEEGRIQEELFELLASESEAETGYKAETLVLDETYGRNSLSPQLATDANEVARLENLKAWATQRQSEASRVHYLEPESSVPMNQAIKESVALPETEEFTFSNNYVFYAPVVFKSVCIGCHRACLLYTSPSPRDATLSRMPSSA